jgi:superfamily II DNA helicase RecQ
MARLKPVTNEDFLEVNGVGEKKCEQYAQVFLHAIAQHRRLGKDQGPSGMSS